MSTGRKVLWSAIVVVAFFALLEGALAAFGVHPQLYSEDPYVGFSSTSPLFVKATGADGRAVYRTAANKLTLFNQQQFPVDKGEDTKRVFCLGGSTTFGRPYDDATSFCGWLRDLLPEVDPKHHWEVINAGGVSYASYRVAVIMEELLKYQPDLFVIYSGHNEFLEERTYRDVIAVPPAVRGLGGLVAHTRTAAAIKHVIDSVRSSEPAASKNVTELGDEVKTRLDASIGPDDYTRDDALKRQIIAHFRFNLARMVDMARSVGADVELVVPASNLKDCTPFKSEHADGLDQAQLKQWQEDVAWARQAAIDGDVPAAVKNLESAAKIDGRNAAELFLLGGFLVEDGRYDDALKAFERARDEDVCPLRMLGEMGDVVRSVAKDRGAGLTDFDAIVRADSDHGIPGSKLFLDHVHPTIDGNGLLARSILDDLIRRGVVDDGAGVSDEVFAAVRKRILAGVDDHDRALALMKLSKVLGWAGKLQEAARLAAQAVALVPDDSAIQYQAGLTAQLTGHPDVAVRHYREAVRIQPDADLPHQNLGVLLRQKRDIEGAIEHFRAALKYARTAKTVADNRLNLADTLILKGAVLYRQHRVQNALECFTESNELMPNRADTLSRLGSAQLAMNQPKEALASLNRAVELAPGNGHILNRLAVAYTVVGRFGDAANAWRRALRAAPDLETSPEALPRVLHAMGRDDLVRQLEDVSVNSE